jgi:hypothetical protein
MIILCLTVLAIARRYKFYCLPFYCWPGFSPPGQDLAHMGHIGGYVASKSKIAKAGRNSNNLEQS